MMLDLSLIFGSYWKSWHWSVVYFG